MLLAIQTGRTRDPVKGIKRGFVAWLPLMAVVAWVFGIMGYTGFQLNSQTVTIGALTLGLGVDYAIHIATRLEEEAEHDPHVGPKSGHHEPSPRRVEAMGAAAVTTAGGFSVLNLSSLVPPPSPWPGLCRGHNSRTAVQFTTSYAALCEAS